MDLGQTGIVWEISAILIVLLRHFKAVADSLPHPQWMKQPLRLSTVTGGKTHASGAQDCAEQITFDIPITVIASHEGSEYCIKIINRKLIRRTNDLRSCKPTAATSGGK